MDLIFKRALGARLKKRGCLPEEADQAAGQKQEAARAEDFLKVFRSNRSWRE